MSKETFNYTYSASQQEEIKKIREKYSAPEKQEDKMEQLRRLDKSVTKPGTDAASSQHNKRRQVKSYGGA